MTYIEDVDISNVEVEYLGEIDLVSYFKQKIIEQLAEEENSLYLY